MLQKIIESLTKDEVRNVKLFLNRTNESADRKDIYLFDQLRKFQKDEAQVATKLYGDNKNSFYRLKNRLKEDIGKSLLVQHSKSSAEQDVINDYLLASHFFSKREYEITRHYLGRAERKAHQIHNLELLDLIYSEQIKLERETVLNNPEELIRKKRDNRNQLNKLSELDDLLAMLMYRIKVSQNYASKSDTVLDLLSETIHDYSSEENLKANPVVRFKIYHGVSRILLQNQDFVSLEAYLKETLISFEQDKLFNKRNHDTKLQMLTYLCNALFKNEKYQESLDWAEKLLVAMREHNYLLYDKYLFYYYNSLYYNYTVLDGQKSLKILMEASEDEVIQQEPLNLTFIILQMAVYYFDDENYKRARKELIKLQMNDGFEKLDVGFRIKVLLLEIMAAVELEDSDFVESKLRRLRAAYGQINWNEVGCAREDILGQIIPLLIIARNEKEEVLLSHLVANLRSTDARADLVNYHDWINKKTGGTK